MNENRRSVFLDHTGRRWRRFLHAMGVAGLVFSVLGALFCFSIVALPLSPFSFQGQPRAHRLRFGLDSHEQAATRFRARRTRDKLMRFIAREGVHKEQARHAAPSKPWSTTIGFYVNWDPQSFTSFALHAQALDYVMPEWLALDASGGSFTSRFSTRTDDPAMLRIAAQQGVEVIPMLDNVDHGAFQWPRLKTLLSNPAAQKALAVHLRQYLTAQHFAGVNLDLEPPYGAIPQSETKTATRLLRQGMPKLTETIRAELAPAHLLVTQDVPPDDPNFDYAKLSEANDLVVVMFYDQHTQDDDPGPIAGQRWVEAQADKVLGPMDPSKVIIGLANYAYDWPVKLGKRQQVVSHSTGKKLKLGTALSIASEAQTPVQMDDNDLNPFFAYSDTSGADHVVYMLDAVTALNEITALKGYQARGAALWYLGAEDPCLWSYFNSDHLTRHPAMDKLSKVTYSSAASAEAEDSGEIMEIASHPSPGIRKLETDEDGIITSETFTQYPSALLVRHFGHKPGLLALTFDDGPDPVYTPKILQVLKEENAPGTFFTLGKNAQEYPWLVRRCFETGNEVGNHTFTHPHIADVSPIRAELEVNATQRILEACTGHSSRLFRPPFGEGSDTNAHNASEYDLMARMQGLGYTTVGMNIDPNDYTRPGVDTIVERVLQQRKLGNIILLHDGGGDREQTVEALKQIIPLLRKQGYRFVTVSDLLGESKDAVFPPVRHSQLRIVGVDRFVFESSFWFSRLVQFVFVGTLVLALLRILLTAPLAIMQARRGRDEASEPYTPPVTVIIPSYNEQDVACKTIHSVLESGYPDLHVIFVDDGSTDNTAEVIRQAYGSEPRLTYIRKENGGKASALNEGLKAAETEIVVCVDADTMFAPGSITRLVSQFRDPRVGAVAGNVKVGNRLNPLTVWQSIEYVTGQNFDRRAYGYLNSVPVVPGAIGAWRRSAVMEAGGYEVDTLAEDTDLTFRLRLMGYHTRTENSALAFTEAPDTIRALAKQRYRWAFGILQSLWKHKRELFRPRYGAFSMVVMPCMWLFSILFQALAPIVDIMAIWALCTANGIPVLIYWAALFVLDFVVCLLAFALDHEDYRQLLWLFWQRFFYRQFMYYIIIKALLSAVRGHAVGWGKLQRKATATMPGSGR